jgi:hypothetical protein
VHIFSASRVVECHCGANFKDTPGQIVPGTTPLLVYLVKGLARCQTQKGWAKAVSDMKATRQTSFTDQMLSNAWYPAMPLDMGTLNARPYLSLFDLSSRQTAHAERNSHGNALGGLDDASTYASCSVGLQEGVPDVCRMQSCHGGVAAACTCCMIGVAGAGERYKLLTPRQFLFVVSLCSSF